MIALLDFVLLVAGVVLPLPIVASVFLSRRRIYRAWAKIIAIFAGIAAIAWGAIESLILYLPMMRHTLSQLQLFRAALAGLCIGCIFTALIPRSHKTLEVGRRGA